MKVERFKISTLYRGMALEGVCWVIYPSTYQVVMEKPYKGLSKEAYFPASCLGSFTGETLRGRATWDLGRLYEQYQAIRYDYAKYKKLMEEWKQYSQQVYDLKEEAMALRQGADAETQALIDFHCNMSDKDALQYFQDLTEKHGIMPLSLSPSVLATSLRLIEEELKRTNRINKMKQYESNIEKTIG